MEKTYKILVDARDMEDMVNKLAKHGLKFEMSPERRLNDGTWYRRFSVRTTPWRIRRFCRIYGIDIW